MAAVRVADPEARLRREIGERIRYLRQERGLTQQQLAEWAGIHAADLSHIENGRRTPRANTITRIALVLGVRPGDLWPEDLDFFASRDRGDGASYSLLFLPRSRRLPRRREPEVMREYLHSASDQALCRAA